MADPISTGGPTGGQLDRAMAGLAQELGKLPNFLGAAAKQMQPELDRLKELFGDLRENTANLAKGGFNELAGAVKKLETLKFTGDIPKIIDQLQTGLEKAERVGQIAA